MERTITTTCNHTVDAVRAQLLCGLDTSIGLEKVRTARCLKNRTTAVDSIGRADTIKNFEVSGYHPRVSADDSDNFKTTLVGSPLDSPNVGIHAGRVTTARKDCNAFHIARKYDRYGLSMTVYSSFSMLRKGNGSVTGVTL
jgi:hypothetical protein